MDALNQMDPKLYLNVLRKQSEVWADLAAALGDTWRRAVSPAWAVEVEISIDEILAELSYGQE
jgi:hypothetical protein